LGGGEENLEDRGCLLSPQRKEKGQGLEDDVEGKEVWIFRTGKREESVTDKEAVYILVNSALDVQANPTSMWSEGMRRRGNLSRMKNVGRGCRGGLRVTTGMVKREHTGYPESSASGDRSMEK